MLCEEIVDLDIVAAGLLRAENISSSNVFGGTINCEGVFGSEERARLLLRRVLPVFADGCNECFLIDDSMSSSRLEGVIPHTLSQRGGLFPSR